MLRHGVPQRAGIGMPQTADLLKILGCRFFHRFPGIQHHNAVGRLQRQIQVVRDE